MKKVYLINAPTRKVLYTLILIFFVLVFIYCILKLNISTISGYIPSISNSLESQKSEVSGPETYLAIIIDDFGSGRDGVKELMSIDRHLTFAVMPFCEFTEEDAKTGHEKGYEIIVHLPMEANKGKRSWLGPNPILTGMKADNIRSIVEASFENVPFAVGANIHMGSKASSKESIVSTVLDVIKEKNIYFVDSCTAAQPVAKRIADEKGILCYERDVFLDGQQPKEFVKKRLEEACKIAKKKGYAVAIGHVGIEGGKVTAKAINEMLPIFDANNIKLVFISEMIQ